MKEYDNRLTEYDNDGIQSGAADSSFKNYKIMMAY